MMRVRRATAALVVSGGLIAGWTAPAAAAEELGAAPAGPPLPRHARGRRLRGLRRRPGGPHHAHGRRLRHGLRLPGRPPRRVHGEHAARPAPPPTPRRCSRRRSRSRPTAPARSPASACSPSSGCRSSTTPGDPAERAGADPGARGASNAQTVDVATAGGTAIATGAALRHDRRLRRRPGRRDDAAGLDRRRAAHRPAGRRRARRGLQPGGPRLRRRRADRPAGARRRQPRLVPAGGVEAGAGGTAGAASPARRLAWPWSRAAGTGVGVRLPVGAGSGARRGAPVDRPRPAPPPPAGRSRADARSLLSGAAALALALSLPGAQAPGPGTAAAAAAGRGGPRQITLAAATSREGRAAPVRVRIPSIDVDSSLLRLGVDAPAPCCRRTTRPGRLVPRRAPPRGRRPGRAHRARRLRRRSGRLLPAAGPRGRRPRLGDRTDGTTVRFTVTRRGRFPKDAFPTTEVYAPTPRAELRLITCGGAFDRSARSYLDNVVVYPSVSWHCSAQRPVGPLAGAPAGGVPVPAPVGRRLGVPRVQVGVPRRRPAR